MKKSLLNKLKLGLAGLSLIGASYFNAKAQENYIPKYNTISHEILQIEYDSLDCDSIKNSLLKNLDDIIDSSKIFIEKKENYTKQEIAEISMKIHSLALKKCPEIKKEKDFCYRMSLTYLAVGQENNLPFYGVMNHGLPGHMFIRFDQKKDGHNPSNSKDPINKEDINIETTAGKIQENQKGLYSDKYYIDSKGLSKNSLEKTSSLTNLTKKELLSIAYLERGRRYAEKSLEEDGKLKPSGRYSRKVVTLNKEAIKNKEKSIELNPKNITAYLSLANFWTEMPWCFNYLSEPIATYNKEEKAIEILKKSLELDSLYPKTYELLGKCYFRAHKYKETIKYSAKTLELIEKIENTQREHKLSWDTYFALTNLKVECYIQREMSYRYLGDVKNAKEDSIKVRELIPTTLIDKEDFFKFLLEKKGE